MRSPVVAIHQPNFFPWLGYFAKIARSDVFVFLDDAQLKNSGGSWVNRVRIANRGQASWLTASLDRRVSGVQAIAETRLVSSDWDWRQKNLRILENGYRKAPFFDEGIALIGPLLLYEEDLVSRYNVNAITRLAAAFDITQDRFQLATELHSDGGGTQRLISLVHSVGGNCYLSGDGASGYQEDELFVSSGLDLERLHFVEPVRQQVGGSEDGFIPGLSVIDSLFNLGVERTAKLIWDFAAQPLAGRATK